MRLVDLQPAWLLKDGKRIGFIFLSPTHLGNTENPQWQTCFLVPTPNSEQWDAIESYIAMTRQVVQLCTEGATWTCTPPIEEATFENISVTPSLDGSKGGNWHGYITNGEIVGGL